MPAAVAEGLAAALLLGTLWFAVAAPKGLPEVTAAAPAAAIAVLTGLVPLGVALDEVRAVAPTVGFLAAVLVLAELCDAEGLFSAAGTLLTRASRRDPHRLLALVFVAAALATAVLSLDATIVLLTPVVYTCATRLRMRARPHVYACAHLANAASLLLPVSNLTNLLALRASGLSFAGFAAVMALPWLVVVAVEYVAFRWFFATDLAIAGTPPAAEGATPVGAGDGFPWFAVAVLGLTLLGSRRPRGWAWTRPGRPPPEHWCWWAAAWPCWPGGTLHGGRRRGGDMRWGSSGRRTCRSSASCSPLAWWSARCRTTAPGPGWACCCRGDPACSRCSGWRWSPRCWRTWSTTCRRR